LRTIRVNAGGGYDIVISISPDSLLHEVGDKIRAALPKAKIAAIITDDNVKKLYLEPVVKSFSTSHSPLPTPQLIHYSIPPGEDSKNGGQYLSLLDWLCENKLTRSDVIVALGGGVVGDLAGFTAATYLRGIPFVQIPTTLLAMVDSSVGGKTGIDLRTGKNLAGVFYQPSLVLCDTSALASLPESVFKDGCAEVIKYGMIASPEILELLKTHTLETTFGLVNELIEKCISIKRDIVQLDEFDTGDRMLLNFGHTIAHAIEKLSGYKISHGFAVAAGMAIDTRAAFRKGLCPKDRIDALEHLLNKFGLPNSADYSAKELYEAALFDKKLAGDQITIIIPTAFGKSELKKIPAVNLLDWIETGLAP
jgi:3-dehydroquinate synthase